MSTRVFRQRKWRSGVLTLIGTLTFLLPACDKDPHVIAPPSGTVRIRMETSDFNGIGIRLSAENARPTDGFELTRNGATKFSGIYSGRDTLLNDTGLIPSSDYTYRGYLLRNGVRMDSSEALVARTRDTSSASFEWDVNYFGNGGYTMLRDVAALAPNDVWAVGEIIVPDSSGNPKRYNAVHWDGRTWTLFQIMTNLNYGNGNVIRDPRVAMGSVYAVSQDDIWFISEPGGVTRLHGTQWEEMIPPYIDYGPAGPGAASRIWGTKDNLYFVSTKGWITWWDGKDFRKVANDIPYEVTDVWGTGDTAVCIASNWSEASYSRVLRLVHGKAESMPETGLQRAMKTLWFVRQNRIFASGGYNEEFDGVQWSVIPYAGTYFKLAIRGTSESDIFCVGQVGTITHYNGLRWNLITDAPSNGSMDFLSVACLKDEVFIAGGTGRKAVILHGKRR